MPQCRYRKRLTYSRPVQWRIQDFPEEGGANPQGGGANVLFGQKIPENCMKMKEFGPRGGGASLAPPSLDPPMLLCSLQLPHSVPAL